MTKFLTVVAKIRVKVMQWFSAKKNKKLIEIRDKKKGKVSISRKSRRQKVPIQGGKDLGPIKIL